MVIKNVGFSLAGAAGNYSNRKLDMTDVTRRTAESDSTFASQLKVHANPVDKIEISQHAVDNRSTLSQARNSILDQISQDADPARLDNLKKLVSTNQYSINPAEIAAAMLLN